MASNQIKKFAASHKFARIAPRKARLVADMIRGKGIEDALATLEFSPRRGAWFIKTVLRSAIANAEEANLDVGRLFVSETRVDEGPTIKRFQPKDRGRSHPIMKRTSHIHVAVDVR
ncbi:MAG: ribosomal protein [Pseudomonadota bacterium]|jgi:large subunit ribosomal protein L22|nr:50S ribosomal protein L22 [Pseudomonadota bacterium]